MSTTVACTDQSIPAYRDCVKLIICLLTSLTLFFMAIAAWKIVKSWLSPEAVNKIR